MSATRSSRPVPARPPPPARRGWWILGGIAAVIVAAGIVAWRGSRRDRAAALVERQRVLLSSSDRLRTEDVDAFVREADCMTREQATAVRAALAAEWRRSRRESIDRYFAAAEADRQALLDEDIVRLRNHHRLLAALNPMDAPGGPVRALRPARGPQRDEDAAETGQNRRALAGLYDAAIAARARERGITLPTFR